MPSKFLNISTDNTLGGNSPSDEIVSSQKAIKYYIDNHGGSATWGNITGTLSNQTDLQNALDAKANDNAVVHLAGTEDISGAKTFSDNVYIKTTTLGYNETPVSGTSIPIYTKDKNDVVFGAYEIIKLTNGNNVAQINVANDVSGTKTWASTPLGIGVTQAGDTYTFAPTPTSSDNSTKIATTAFVKNVASNLAMPSATHQSVTVGASGTEYTPTKDGVYYFKMDNGTLSAHWVNVSVDGRYVANYWAQVANNSFGLPPFFVRKGGKIKITYGSGISGGSCYFVPTVGAN